MLIQHISYSVADVVLFSGFTGGGKILGIIDQSTKLTISDGIDDVSEVISIFRDGEDVVDTVSDFVAVVQFDLEQERPFVSVSGAADQDVVEALGNGVPVISDVLGLVSQVLELDEGILVLVDGVDTTRVLVDFRAPAAGKVADVVTNTAEGEAVGSDQKDGEGDDSSHL